MSEPSAQSAYRVPRSHVDDFFERGETLAPSRTSAAIVVSVDGASCTVQIGDDIISGVLYLGDPPRVGDVVDLEARGDLMVIPATADLDTFLEGAETDAQHIVSDEDPGKPPDVVINVGGSMRDLDAWQFLGTDQQKWIRELNASGQGMRCYQVAAPVLTARNLCTNPSGEAGIGPSDAGRSWHANNAFGAYDTRTVISTSTDHVSSGAVSLKAEWPTGGTLPGNMVLEIDGHVAGQQYTAQVWVKVPTGSPHVRLDNTFVASTALTPIKDDWVPLTLTYTAGGVTQFIGVTTPPGQAVDGGVAYLDALSVVAGPTPLATYFDGSTVDTMTEHYVWVGTPHLSVSEHWTGATAPAEAGAGGVGNDAVLWAEEGFEVEPHDVVNIEAHVAELVAGSTVQAVLLFSPEEEVDATVADPDTLVVAQGSPVAVSGTDTILTVAATIPVTVTFPVSGAAQPRTATLGLKLVGDGDAQLVVTSTSVTRTPAGWPLGSLWMDPDAQDGGLVTAADSGNGSTTAANLTLGTAGTWYAVPGMKKAVLAAPPSMGGLVIARGSVDLFVNSTTGQSVELGFAVAGVFAGSIGRASASASGVVPLSWQTIVPVGPGEEIEILPMYRYLTNPATAFQYFRGNVQTVFMPGAVLTGSPAADPALRYWDGDSWRPEMLLPAGIDVTQDAVTVPPVKTTTATTLARSSTTLHEGQTLTLTATVSAGASGTVTFHRAPAATGPWTSLGGAELSGSTASKSWTTVRGTWYFMATYAGSVTHKGSSSAPTAVTTVQVLQKHDMTINCGWAQAYGDGGNKLSGSSHDASVHQGYYSATLGNRRSLLRFDSRGIPDDAEVVSVVLVCRSGGWIHGSGITLCVGSFVSQDTPPATWPVAKVVADRSQHVVDVGGFSLNLTSWAATALEGSDFSGIALGPAPSQSRTYFGYSAPPGNSQFSLKVAYQVWR